jgi:hypothetical protein
MGVLNQLLRVGLLYHVTRQHDAVEDKKLFYRFSTREDLQALLSVYDHTGAGAVVPPVHHEELVRFTALKERFSNLEA